MQTLNVNHQGTQKPNKNSDTPPGWRAWSLFWEMGLSTLRRQSSVTAKGVRPFFLLTHERGWMESIDAMPLSACREQFTFTTTLSAAARYTMFSLMSVSEENTHATLNVHDGTYYPFEHSSLQP